MKVLVLRVPEAAYDNLTVEAARKNLRAEEFAERLLEDTYAQPKTSKAERIAQLSQPTTGTDTDAEVSRLIELAQSNETKA